MCNKFLNQIISSPKVCLITWKDAVTEGEGGWVDGSVIEEIVKTPLPIMWTIGFILYETSEFICVTDSLGSSETGNITKIPRGMIVNVEIIQTEKDK